jgi:hypothetical protein
MRLRFARKGTMGEQLEYGVLTLNEIERMA